MMNISIKKKNLRTYKVNHYDHYDPDKYAKISLQMFDKFCKFYRTRGGQDLFDVTDHSFIGTIDKGLVIKKEDYQEMNVKLFFV